MNNNINDINLKLYGIKCIGCIHTIKNELENKDGIINIFIEYEKKQAMIKFNSEIIDSKDILSEINAFYFCTINTKEPKYSVNLNDSRHRRVIFRE